MKLIPLLSDWLSVTRKYTKLSFQKKKCWLNTCTWILPFWGVFNDDRCYSDWNETQSRLIFAISVIVWDVEIPYFNSYKLTITLETTSQFFYQILAFITKSYNQLIDFCYLKKALGSLLCMQVLSAFHSRPL